MFCCTSSDDEVLKRKIVVVGDGTCGKTCLLTVFNTGQFPTGVYVPTIFENSVKDFIVDNKQVVAELWDTAGQEDFDRLRTLSYSDTDVVLVAFAVDSPESLENVTVKWMPEVRRYCAGLPVILVGCKTDLRQDNRTLELLAKTGEQPVTLSKGISMARSIGAYKYVECSAKQNVDVQEVFDAAIRSSIKKKSMCNIM